MDPNSQHQQNSSVTFTQPTPNQAIPPSSTPNEETPVGLTIIVLLGLIFMYPLGMILMWVFMKKWAKWVKIVLTLPLLLIPLLVILLFATLAAMNPSKQFEQADNTKRRSDVNALLNAVNQYEADKGSLPPGISASDSEISASGVDLCSSIVPEYIAQMPTDPAVNEGNPIDPPCPTGYTTGYSIVVTSDNTITVSAPHAGLGEKITVSRSATPI